MADTVAACGERWISEHRHLVVVRADIDATCLDLQHRVVAAVVPHRQSARGRLRGEGQQLMSQADAQDRRTARDRRRRELGDECDLSLHARRIARTWRQHNEVRLAA